MILERAADFPRLSQFSGSQSAGSSNVEGASLACLPPTMTTKAPDVRLPLMHIHEAAGGQAGRLPQSHALFRAAIAVLFCYLATSTPSANRIRRTVKLLASKRRSRTNVPVPVLALPGKIGP